MKITKTRKHTVVASGTARRTQFGVKAANVRKKYTVKASSDSYSMADYDIVIYRNSEKVYSGSVYDYSFNSAIKALCKDSENLRVFTEWLADYGVSNLEDADIPTLVIEMITSDWDKATENDEDFYVEISMYGHQHSDVRFEVFYAKDEVKASTTTKRKYTVKASKSAKRAKRVMASDEDGYTPEDNARYEREGLARRIINDIESEYSIKVSQNALAQIMDLADDLSFGKDAHKHGSEPLWVLEAEIYEIIEEDSGIVIASTAVSAAQADTTVSQEDVDELVLYITNDGDLYRGRVGAIIKNLKRKVKNGNYDKELAVKAWQYAADDGVRKYDKEHGSGRGSLAWLNPATRKAIATELRDYYEEEIFYEDSVNSASSASTGYVRVPCSDCGYTNRVKVSFPAFNKPFDNTKFTCEKCGAENEAYDPHEYNEDGTVVSATAINASSDIDVDEIKYIIEEAGIDVWDVKSSRTHLGTIYEVVLDNPDEASSAMDALRECGFTVTFDTMDGNNMFVFIEDSRVENAYLYRVSFEYTSEVVRMDDETSDYQAVLDSCIDQMEAEGKTGYLYTAEEAEAQGWGEDEYVEGGNHGWLLYTGGNLHIEPLGWSDEVGNITASVDTNTGSPRTYDTDSKRDAEYLNALGRGVVKYFNDSGYSKFFSYDVDEGECIYEISDSAITFTSTCKDSYAYIQPLDHIDPNMDDIDDDIDEMIGAITSEILPKF